MHRENTHILGRIGPASWHCSDRTPDQKLWRRHFSFSCLVFSLPFYCLSSFFSMHGVRGYLTAVANQKTAFHGLGRNWPATSTGHAMPHCVQGGVRRRCCSTMLPHWAADGFVCVCVLGAECKACYTGHYCVLFAIQGGGGGGGSSGSGSGVAPSTNAKSIVNPGHRCRLGSNAQNQNWI